MEIPTTSSLLGTAEAAGLEGAKAAGSDALSLLTGGGASPSSALTSKPSTMAASPLASVSGLSAMMAKYRGIIVVAVVVLAGYWWWHRRHRKG